jgi:hypothetical protein
MISKMTSLADLVIVWNIVIAKAMAVFYKIVNGLLYSDGVHLTKNGTSLLINNINDKVGILKHELKSWNSISRSASFPPNCNITVLNGIKSRSSICFLRDVVVPPSTSTPVSRKSTVEQLKPKQKNQLKLRNNQKKTGNVLIIGSSITRDYHRQQYASLHYISEFLVLYSDSFC